MKFLRFLLLKSIPLCFIFIGVILWCIFTVFAGVPYVVVFITISVVFLGMGIGFTVEYLIINNRLKKLNRLCTEIEEGYVLGELLSKPINTVEEEYFKIMKFISRSAVEKTENALRAQEEYRDYVERWIHEIKTPLTACSLILANGGDVKKLKTELKRAENLTESILYCARMRTAEKDTQITEIGVRNAVDEAVKSEMELLLAAGIGVEVEGDFTVYTDRKVLIFILKQFLVNCSKYCPACRIKISLKDGVVLVEDNGEGICSYELPRIFSRGFVGNAGRKYGGGTGMGLYIVHELCQNLNIGLDVQSEEGRYTRFLLTFPKIGQPYKNVSEM